MAMRIGAVLTLLLFGAASARCAEVEKVRRWQACFDAGVAESKAFRYTEAERTLRNACVLASQLGAADTRLADSEMELSRALTRLGKTAEARACVKRALAIHTRHYGPHSAAVATDTLALATNLSASGELDEAERVANEVKSTTQSLFGTTALELAEVYDEFASIQIAKQLPAKALEYAQQALEIRLKRMKNDDPRLALSYDFLFLINIQTEQFDAAESFASKSLALRKAEKAPQPDELARSYQYMCAVHLVKSEFKTVEDFGVKALAVLEACYGATHPKLAGPLESLMIAYTELDRFEDAERTVRRRIQICENTHGLAATELIPFLNHLGYCLVQLNRTNEAERVSDQILLIRQLANRPTLEAKRSSETNQR